ncbi:MAG: ppsA [Candidatus Levybacteria bacterium]|nr:ppsA [Candidatus Levybacteria bacterium]
MVRNPHYIINYSEINKVDEELVGKKAHELGGLWKLGIPLPDGFVITINFYKEFLRLAEIEKKIYKTSAHKHPALSNTVDHLFRKEIIQTPIPQALASELHTYYKHLSGLFKNRPLNIYSSSANGKFISFSNIKGDANDLVDVS